MIERHSVANDRVEHQHLAVNRRVFDFTLEPLSTVFEKSLCVIDSLLQSLALLLHPFPKDGFLTFQRSQRVETIVRGSGQGVNGDRTAMMKPKKNRSLKLRDGRVLFVDSNDQPQLVLQLYVFGFWDAHQILGERVFHDVCPPFGSQHESCPELRNGRQFNHLRFH